MKTHHRSTPHSPARVLPRMAQSRHGLVERRRQLLTTVARTEAELRSLGSNVEPQLADEAQEETTAQLLTRLDGRGRAAIGGALARIEDGTYGRCDECGRAIAAARLAALPEATTCMRCARQQGDAGAPAAS